MALPKDLTNQKFGKLTPVRYVGKSYWECICDCGKTTTVKTYNLTNGHTKSCGCIAKNQSVANGLNSLQDLTGQRFGKLTAVKYHTDLKKWECKCDCGNICYVSQNGLCRKTNKATKSCGCLVSLETANVINIVQGTNVGNIKSQKLSPRNKTGVKGVHYSHGSYFATIRFQGKRYYLVSSKDINVCIAARKLAEEQLHGEFLKWYEEYRKELKNLK